MILKVSLFSWQDRSETQEKMEVERKKVIMVHIRLRKSNKLTTFLQDTAREG